MLSYHEWVYNLATRVTKYFLLPIYTTIKVEGLENVPPDGPLVIASNHLNDADPGIICTRIRRRIAFMAKIELFKVPLLKQFLEAFGAFPVRRGEADIATLRTANELLKQGVAVLIFPEGTRGGEEHQMRQGHPGAAVVALRNDYPVLPIAITGSGRLTIPTMFLHVFRREKVTLTIGEVFHLPRPARLNGESAQEGTQLIMERIAALLPPDYRGYYGEGNNKQQAPDRVSISEGAP